ncbi:uncharacterized protein [Aegilops tauschii subsp. strangulata]|uniref:uncharacterized protein n=1 Tax=Aegilops tauschii subsp. strangulata TaxID=200361 RepID=UPI001ABCDE25|nr:uncharacterized protein LOC120974820 [Aegilops tauschii subsp. strangulata]XP_040257214.1 uncharacterized protein LOC120974820 [Aegilops tauschii subsp. strangulata]
MAGGVEMLVMFWKEWGIQALVLLSFVLQVILLVSAEIRHRRDSGILRAIVWSAFMLADTTAIYALGHMSVNSSKWLPKHQLMAFWAPFLLLHLGGQDKITAYSVEDNRLWLRHLQTFTVQVLAAGYVLYESSIVARRTLLRPAAILMFVVGVIKYGERVWALNCASTSNLPGKNYQSFGRVHIEHPLSLQCGADRDGQVLVAHQLLRIPMHLLKGPLPLVAFHRSMMEDYNWERMYEVAEVQLSLMYEVFFSKAPVIHTWRGRCIHVISPMATVAAFMLFHRFSQKDGDYYNRVDVAATYVLLTGAVVLEITSLLRAMFSSWAEASMANPGKDDDTIYFYTCLFQTLIWVVVACPRCLVRCAMRKAGLPIRHWSGSMGQHNFIHLCTHSRNSRSSKIARRMGREDWWNTLVYTSSIPVPADFSQMLEKQLQRSKDVNKESPDHIHNSRGRAALKRMGISQEELAWWSVDIPLDESILVWHIATHVYLSWYDAEYSIIDRGALAKAIEVLSNYMMFLLAARPYMLPDNASRQSYVELCNKAINHLKYSSAEVSTQHVLQVLK